MKRWYRAVQLTSAVALALFLTWFSTLSAGGAFVHLQILFRKWGQGTADIDEMVVIAWIVLVVLQISATVLLWERIVSSLRPSPKIVDSRVIVSGRNAAAGAVVLAILTFVVSGLLPSTLCACLGPVPPHPGGGATF